MYLTLRFCLIMVYIIYRNIKFCMTKNFNAIINTSYNCILYSFIPILNCLLMCLNSFNSGKQSKHIMICSDSWVAKLLLLMHLNITVFRCTHSISISQPFPHSLDQSPTKVGLRMSNQRDPATSPRHQCIGIAFDGLLFSLIIENITEKNNCRPILQIKKNPRIRHRINYCFAITSNSVAYSW